MTNGGEFMSAVTAGMADLVMDVAMTLPDETATQRNSGPAELPLAIVLTTSGVYYLDASLGFTRGREGIDWELS